MNPIELASEIEGRYRRYLETTFYFKDPILRESFKEELKLGHLCKGPYLEATPVFKTGQTPKKILEEIMKYQPDEGFLKALLCERPLYQHQEEAIKGILNGKNVVIATGTGSGKTEAFLYPILFHLYKEFKEGNLGPGVRALILYPMNALAHDQRERLRDICKNLKDEKSPFHFTFGQYIGETPENENDSRRHARDQQLERQVQDFCIIENSEIVHGELLFRSEMRATPPNILLTNYSMLEYLLLRPKDSELFDKNRSKWWTYIVLDEAHQYLGSRGIEMAMLIRRLKQRLREGGRSEPFRCIATSATLIGEEKDKITAAKFATELFNEQFEENNIILGKTEPIPDKGEIILTQSDYNTLSKIIESNDPEMRSNLYNIAVKNNVQLGENWDTRYAIGKILEQDSRSLELRRIINGSPKEAQYIADTIFQELSKKDRLPSLSNLVQLLMQAKQDPINETPLLSARYHLFIRSLEGAFVSYWPIKKVFLERRVGDKENPAFEIALCRECGQHYFVGQKNPKEGKLGEAILDPSNSNFGARYFRPILIAGDEIEEEGEEKDYSKSEYQLCVQCGAIGKGEPSCGHNNSIRVILEESPDDEDKADQIRRCGACGYNAAGHDPVREVVHGTDGPHAVIATTLYQNLPENRKKILAFADSRQEAAFFAWYLDISYSDILSRNLILNVVKKLGTNIIDGLSLNEISSELWNCYQDKKILPPAMGELDQRKKIWHDVYREFLTDEPRISLEGVGLVKWSIKWPSWFKIPEILVNTPWDLTEKEARDLVFVLLNYMRVDRAVELHAETPIVLNWNDLDIQAKRLSYRIGPPRNFRDNSNYGIRGWDGQTGKRFQFLKKILNKKGVMEEESTDLALRTLRQIWDTITICDQNAPSIMDRLLIPINDARRINPDWWRLNSIKNDDLIYQCDTCGRLQTTSIQKVCQRHRCKGTLKEIKIKELPPNHYRYLYETNLPAPPRVEEHTAQLDYEKAREFQRQFKQDKINVLSCSTTFELGVDLGNLDTIFLRNVPPEFFNYAQRVGRSGRRIGYPGFAITYCRRNPHDLYHFAQPERMLKGNIRSPVLCVTNEKIVTRHLAATVLSFFFRDYPERFETVKSLFGDLSNPSGVSDFYSFLQSKRNELELTLKSIIPSTMFKELGLNDGQWINKISKKKASIEDIFESDSKFSLAEAEISSDFRNVLKIEKESRDKRNYKLANWAYYRSNTIANEDVLTFLSRKVIIPKYGFPVDVVELEIQATQQSQDSSEIHLQRDLSIAISEFAPTNELIANKKVWSSYGIKKVAEREWPRGFYKKCKIHNVFIQWKLGDPEPPMPCGCPLQKFEYIIPSFGFTSIGGKPKKPTKRPTRVFTTRPYFANFIDLDQNEISIPKNSPLISMKKASRGRMIVLCEGRRGNGFYICEVCGAGFRNRQKTHTTPYGTSCNGTLQLVSLAHEFVTDVLQLQFHQKNEKLLDSTWFSYSLAYALVDGAAEVLGVPSTDLNATVRHQDQHAIPPIILYDNVPGGAGLVERLEEPDIFLESIKSALNRVSGSCGCDEMTSCYGCLRNYRNQFAHQYLQRGPVKRYLEEFLHHYTKYLQEK